MLSNLHLHLVCFSSGSARLNTSQFQKINFLKIFAVYSFAPSMPTKNEPPTSGLWVTLKVAHNPEVGGSNPSPATIKTLKPSRFQGFFFAYRTHFCTHFGSRRFRQDLCAKLFARSGWVKSAGNRGIVHLNVQIAAERVQAVYARHITAAQPTIGCCCFVFYDQYNLVQTLLQPMLQLIFTFYIGIINKYYLSKLYNT